MIDILQVAQRMHAHSKCEVGDGGVQVFNEHTPQRNNNEVVQ